MSSYLGQRDAHLQRVLSPGLAPTADELEAHAQLKDKVMDKSFPCVAARSAFNRQGYRLGLYGDMGGPDAALAVCHDLYEFAHEFEDADPTRFSTFIAVFKGPFVCSELHFETLLWQQLQTMHGVDARHFGWDDSVSADPASSEFSFSIGGRAYFVVGLNPRASRLARVTPWPCIVFNPHQQFEQLRHDGKYDGLKKAIRSRDVALQGHINPALSTFGEQSETRQYSGRAVSSHWKCPFLQQARNLS